MLHGKEQQLTEETSKTDERTENSNSDGNEIKINDEEPVDYISMNMCFEYLEFQNKTKILGYELVSYRARKELT